MILMQVLHFSGDGVHILGHINLAKSGQNGIEQFLFVLDYDKKSRIIAKQFYATTQGGLGIDGQAVRIEEDNGFERDALVPLNIRFGEKFEFFADEFDAFSVNAIDKHDVVFHFLFVVAIDLVDEIVYQGAFA